MLPVRTTVRRADDRAAAFSEQALACSGLPVGTIRPTMFLERALNREVTYSDISPEDWERERLGCPRSSIFLPEVFAVCR